MSTPARLALFGAALALVFGAGYGAGAVTGGGSGSADAPAHADRAHTPPMPSGHGAHGSEDYSLRLAATTAPVGPAVPLSFTLTGSSGEPVTQLTPTHTKELHLIVVRRDLTGFQHLHPTRGADGGWRTEVDLSRAGVYRVLADFLPAGGSAPVVLGADLTVGEGYRPEPLPAPAARTEVDGYQVEIGGSPSVGEEAELSFTVTRDGRPVTLEPYLGAVGHLVALRAGDLHYLHTHPTDAAAGQSEMAFETAFPTAGDYRLFVSFQVEGRVHVAAFTVAIPERS